jgi:nucleoside-diphosphate-sugar epimerase
VQVSPNMPTHPGNLYGATKAWGENVGQVFADHFGLSCLCLRIGWAGSRTDERKLNNPHGPAMYLTYEDATILVSACIDAPDDLKFAIFNGISNNRHKKLDITNARELIGYEPQDDGFELQEQLPKA